MRLDPRVAAARSAVGAVLADVAHDAPVFVACSGGPDSLALAAAAAFHAERRPGVTGAVVVDHQLQPGSAAVAATAAQVCERLGLSPVVVRSVDVAGRTNLESAARTARYAAIEEVAAEHGSWVVLLGHTLDDQAETVLLGLARGSGSRSLAGMPRRRGILHRPFLHLPRVDVAAAGQLMLDGAGVAHEHWQDPHNRDDAFARARVRHHLMPQLETQLGPGVAAALARTADQLRDDADLLESLAADLLTTAGDPSTGYDVTALAAAPPALRTRAVRAAILAAGSPAGSVTAAHVAAVAALVTDWRGQGPVSLPGARRASRNCGRLELTPPPSGPTPWNENPPGHTPE